MYQSPYGMPMQEAEPEQPYGMSDAQLSSMGAQEALRRYLDMVRRAKEQQEQQGGGGGSLLNIGASTGSYGGGGSGMAFGGSY